jgi:hypothetical protein
MKPLSSHQRFVYRLAIVIVFIAVIPVLVLYANGFRPTREGFLKTGGLYIATNRTGADIFINNKLVKQSYFFKKGFFFENQTPGTYSLVVSRPGYFSWYKDLSVKPEDVTEAYAFLVPEKPGLKSIERFTPAAQTSTGAPRGMVETPAYTAATSLFADSSPVNSILKDNNIQLSVELKYILAKWLGQAESAPAQFCEYVCTNSIDVFEADSDILNYSFLPGFDAVVLVSTKNQGVYLAEIDGRDHHNIFPIYPVAGADFRIRADDTIIIKDGSLFFELGL